MAERYFMFNYSDTEENDYGQEHHAAMFRHGYRDGVCYEAYGEDSLLVSDPVGSSVTLRAGVLRMQGFVYELTEALNLLGSAYIPGEKRTDAVVIRLNKSASFGIHAGIKIGVNGSDTPPLLERAGNIYEMCPALILYDGAGQVTIADTRDDEDLCGRYGMTSDTNHGEFEQLAADMNSRLDLQDAAIQLFEEETNNTITNFEENVGQRFDEQGTLLDEANERIAALEESVSTLLEAFELHTSNEIIHREIYEGTEAPSEDFGSDGAVYIPHD